MARAFGHDTVESRTDGSRVLTCARSKGWIGRKRATHTSSEHPGTAVHWEGKIFEVLEAAARADGRIAYRLAPWDDRHAIRVLQRYDGASEQVRDHEQSERKAGLLRRRLAILLAPLAGHLPADVQQRWEWDFGAPARGMTIASALPLFVLGILGLLASRVAAFGGIGFLPWLAGHPLFVSYLAAESGMRLWVAFVLAEPAGSLPGLILYEIWRKVRPGPAAGPGKVSRPTGRGLPAEDRFRMMEPLLALLSRDEQERLESRFGFESLRWGRITAALLLWIGGLNVAASLLMLVAGLGGYTDLVWLAGGGALLLEQLARRRQLSQGRPAGSMLGALVRPLARSLLQESCSR